MTGIYKIENTITGEVYVGQSKNIEKRWANHRSNYKAKNKVRKYALYRDMRYYGIDKFKFEVLEECKIDELDNKENYWIAYYAERVHCYNILYPEGVERL